MPNSISTRNNCMKPLKHIIGTGIYNYIEQDKKIVDPVVARVETNKIQEELQKRRLEPVKLKSNKSKITF